MPSNLPRNKGTYRGLEPTARPDLFPSDIDTLRKKVEPETIVFDGSGADTSRPYSIAPCEYWSIYIFGTTPDVDVQVCMNPKFGQWVTLNASALGNTDYYEGSGGQHPWLRIVINSGNNVDVHLFRKYATY